MPQKIVCEGCAFFWIVVGEVFLLAVQDCTVVRGYLDAPVSQLEWPSWALAVTIKDDARIVRPDAEARLPTK
jgi:hypothetical protein